MDRKKIKNGNQKLYINYAELTDRDMFYLEGKSDEYIAKVQVTPPRDIKEILDKLPRDKEQE